MRGRAATLSRSATTRGTFFSIRFIADGKA